jgi:uncharacterized membrane protein
VKFNISLAKLVGEPSDRGWTVVHDFQPEDGDLIQTRGHLLAVISVVTEDGLKGVSDSEFDSQRATLTHDIAKKLSDSYVSNPESLAFNALKDAVSKLSEEYKSRVKSLSIAAASLVDSVVYSVVSGNAEVVIYRNGALAKIISGPSDLVVAASGRPEQGDVLVLATSQFLNNFSNIELKTAIESKETEDIANTLRTKMSTRKYSEDLGAVFIKFNKKNIFSFIPKLKIMRREKSITQEEYEFEPKAPKKSVVRRITKLLPGKGVYIQRDGESVETRKSRKLAVSVGAILLLLLAVSIVFGIKQKTDKEKRSRYESRLVQAKHNLEEAVSLFSLNPERSRELFVESRNLARELTNEEVTDSELDELIGKLEENSGYILGEYEVTPELFVDLSLLTSGFEGKDVAVSEDIIYVLEKEGQKVASVAIDSKKTQVIAGPDDIDSSDSIAAYSGKAFVVTKVGVFKIIDQSSEQTSRGKPRRVSLAIEKDWDGGILPYAYAGNFYILEKDSSNIWRYPGIEDTFGGRGTWFGSGVEPDLSNVISWTIDGSIWLLSSSGQISKYSLGRSEAFGISGVNPELETPVGLYTNEDLEYVYILDRENSRVVVLTKSGEYRAQYKSSEISSAVDLAVSEKEKRIIVLVKDKLYSIEIKHKD